MSMTREQAVRDVDMYSRSVDSLRKEIEELYHRMAEDADKLHRAAYFLAN